MPKDPFKTKTNKTRENACVSFFFTCVHIFIFFVVVRVYKNSTIFVLVSASMQKRIPTLRAPPRRPSTPFVAVYKNLYTARFVGFGRLLRLA